jgi:hypothetical protein
MLFLKGGALRGILTLLVLLLALATPPRGWSQTMPDTGAETLAGQPMVLADALRGRSAILVMSFSREAGTACDEWTRKLAADPALAAIPVYRAAMLEAAPGFVRGWIKSALRKQLSAADQQRYVLFSSDEKRWRSYLSVSNDKLPAVLLLSKDGLILWRGQGSAALLTQLKAALHR